jgi:glutathione-regulated potassium-efflux system ancillary protein KefG
MNAGTDRSAAEKRVLVLFAHPALHHSRVQRAMLTAARHVPDITVHDLYESYPDFDIDVAHEQSLLLTHDTIVVQHPFYWYSTPPLVKQWEDLVLEHGWAYGRGGTALHGKSWMHAVSAGGRHEAYQPDGHNRYTVTQLLAPLEQTARLCGMTWLAPFVVHGTHLLHDADIAEAAKGYAARLQQLRDGVGTPEHVHGAVPATFARTSTRPAPDVSAEHGT